jgi:tetratricopeptide (TPR) repeat protein
MLRTLFRLGPQTSAAEAALAVDTALGEIDPALRAQRDEFLRALSLGAGAEGERAAPDATLAALRALFASLAAREPLVLFVDDWQWADDASNQVLTAIRGLAQRAVFVILASRELEGAPSAGTQVLELSPLRDNEAAETIEQLLPSTDPFVAAEIRRYAGGNPLFIEELCHSAAHDDSVQRLGRPHGGAAWLNQLVESRVERLPAAQAELVRAAAVIGNVVPAWLLERLTGCGEDHPLVRGLAERDLVFPAERAGTLRFKHGITRDVVYDSVGLHARRAMHLRIAESLQQHSASAAQEESLEALAYHFAAGGNAPQAAHYAELAGDKAVAASALDRAKTQYRAALAALDQLATSPELARRWISIAQRLALVCVFDASRSDLPVFERAVALAAGLAHTGAIARTTYWLGFIRYSLGEAHPAIELCERALAAARRAGDDPLAMQIIATLGQAYTAACRYDRALPLLDRAIAVKRQHRSGRHTNVGLAFSLVCRACVLGDRGLFEQAHACFDEAFACVVGTHQIGATIHGWHSAVLLWQGRWEDARVAAVESARIAELTRSLFQLSIARAMGDYADWMLERRPESLQGIVTATAWLDSREGGLFHSLNHGWLADGFAASGHAGDARRHAARALRRARQRDLIGVAMAYRALARLAAQSGDDAAARRYLALALRTAHERDSAHELAATRLCEAEIAGAHGERARALALLDEALPAFETMRMAWHMDVAKRLYAQIG